MITKRKVFRFPFKFEHDQNYRVNMGQQKPQHPAPPQGNKNSFPQIIRETCV